MRPNEKLLQLASRLPYLPYAIVRNWYLVLFFSLLCGGFAFGRIYFQPTTYTATAVIYVDALRDFRDEASIWDITRSYVIANDLAFHLNLSETRQQVRRSLRAGSAELTSHSDSAQAVGASYRAIAIGKTQLLRIVGAGNSPDGAAMVANTAAQFAETIYTSGRDVDFTAAEFRLTEQQSYIQDQLVQVTTKLDELGVAGSAQDQARLQTLQTYYQQSNNRLQSQLKRLREVKVNTGASIVLIEPAVAPDSQTERPLIRQTLLGLILGTLIGCAVIVFRESLNDAIHAPRQLCTSLGVPILGSLTHDDDAFSGPVAFRIPESHLADEYRNLRIGLKYAQVDRPLRRIVVTSATPSEGKSTLSTNLSLMFANEHRKPLLIDADMHRPRIHELLKLTNRRGLSQLFVTEELVDLFEQSLQQVGSVAVLPAGYGAPNPSALCQTDRAAEILKLAGETHDVVIVDTPPVAVMSDAAALSRHVDGVILVLRVGKASRHAFVRAVSALRLVNAPILGVVITDTNNPQNKRSRYYAQRRLVLESA